MRRSLLSIGRQLIEAFAFIPAFITFSGVIPKYAHNESLGTIINNTAKHSLLGVLWTTSVLKSLEEYDQKPSGEGRCSRLVRVYEPTVKAVVVTYALCLDSLMSELKKEHHPQLLYVAFGAFTLIIGRRAVLALQQGDAWIGIMLTIASISNIFAGVGVHSENESMSMVSLLCGGAASVGVFAKMAKDFITHPRKELEEAVPLLDINYG